MRAAVFILCATALFSGIGGSSAQTRLRVYSATDTSAVSELIRRFELANPSIDVDYAEFNTSELYEAVLEDDETVDVVISSAMDLQAKLVNNGMAYAFRPSNADDLPDWAQWREELYGFTYEPVAMVYNKAAFANRPLPRTRSELASMIRDEPDFFQGKLGTYDIHLSGVGYLFATQDAQRGYQFSRLIESFGRAGARTYCCTLEVVDRVASGELVYGYNVIGSYALGRARQDERVGIYLLDDYALIMMRTAFIPKRSQNKAAAVAFVDFLLSPEGQRTISRYSALLPLDPKAAPQQEMVEILTAEGRSVLPIRLGAGLLTYLDKLKKSAFLADWRAAMQPPRTAQH